MDNYNEEMDRTSMNNDNDNDSVNDNVNDNVNVNVNINNDDNDDMINDCNLAIDALLPIVSLKRRSPTTDSVLNDDETNAIREVTADTIVVAVAAIATATATVRQTAPRSITPNLFLPILVPEEEDEHRDDSSVDGGEKEGEEEGDWKGTNNEEEEVRTKGEEGNTDNDAETGGKETQTRIPQNKTDSHYPAVRLFPSTKTTVVPTVVVPALPLPLLLCTPQQHKPNEEATYDDIICHYNALIQKQQRRRRSTTTPRTPNQQHYESLSYSSSSNEGTGDGKKNGVSSSAHSAQPLLLSPYFLFTPDVVSSQDEYIVPHDPPALVITDTVPIMNVDNKDDDDDDDVEERQLCAQLSKIPSLSKVFEEAEAVAVNPHYTDQNGGTTVGVGSSFINNKTTMTQPSSVRPLRMRRNETKMISSGIFRTSITGLGGVGSNGTTAMPLLRRSSGHRTTTMTTKTLYAAPVVPPSSIDESL